MSVFENSVPVAWRQNEVVALSPDEAYNAFADTDRFSRLRGDGLLTLEDINLDSGEVVRQVVDGGGAEYIEEPFEWEKGRHFSVVRRHTKGILKGYTWAVGFHPADEGCELQFAADFYPRFGWARPLLWLVVRFVISREVRRIVDQVRAQIRTHRQGAFKLPAPSAESGLANEGRLQRARDQLVALNMPASVVDSMLHLIREETDLDLMHIKPVAMAQERGFDEEQTIKTFLHATRHGYLELRWSLICPVCRGSKEEADDLSRLKSEAHCSSCNVSFDGDFDSSVQLTFRPVAALRPIEAGYYCVGGPMRTPHVVAQTNIEPGEEASLSGDLIAGMNAPQLRVASSGQLVALDQLGTFELTASSLERIGDSDAIVLINRTDHQRKLSLEEGEPPTDVLTAARVIAMRTFRDLFSDQILAPDAVVSLQPMAFLFTDLKGSTAMYEADGDATSFSKVKAHFDILLSEIEGHHGALIKTIGDAIMASFDDPADAMRCAISMQRRVHAESDLVLKLGLHYGRAMAVTLNDRLDYFGATVNRAARLEGQSSGGDVVCSRTVYDDPDVSHVLKSAGLKLAYESLQVKGVEQAMDVVRVEVVTTR